MTDERFGALDQPIVREQIARLTRERDELKEQRDAARDALLFARQELKQQQQHVSEIATDAERLRAMLREVASVLTSTSRSLEWLRAALEGR